MKRLLIVTILLLLYTSTGYAYSINALGSYGGKAYYDVYNYKCLNGQWFLYEGFASGGERFNAWNVVSDYGRSGQVWIEVLIESDLTWTINNDAHLENLFFTGDYLLGYYIGNTGRNAQSSLFGTLEFRDQSGGISFTHKQRILVDLGEENYSSVQMYLDTPIISADPLISLPGEPDIIWAGIRLSLDSCITYILPSENPDPVPEPGTFLLFGAGLIGVAGRLWKHLPVPVNR